MFNAKSLHTSHGSCHLARTGSIQPVTPSDGRRETLQARRIYTVFYWLVQMSLVLPENKANYRARKFVSVARLKTSMVYVCNA